MIFKEEKRSWVVTSRAPPPSLFLLRVKPHPRKLLLWKLSLTSQRQTECYFLPTTGNILAGTAIRSLLTNVRGLPNLQLPHLWQGTWSQCLEQETTSQESHCNDFEPRLLWHFPGHPNDSSFTQSSCVTHMDPVRRSLLHEHGNLGNSMNVLSNNFLFQHWMQHGSSRPQTALSSCSPSSPLHWCYSAFMLCGMISVALGNILQGQHYICLLCHLTNSQTHSWLGDSACCQY